MSVEIARKYVEGLNLRQKERDEVENVICGYMSDCNSKDAQIDKLENKIVDILDEFEGAECLGAVSKILRQYGR